MPEGRVGPLTAQTGRPERQHRGPVPRTERRAQNLLVLRGQPPEHDPARGSIAKPLGPLVAGRRRFNNSTLPSQARSQKQLAVGTPVHDEEG